MSDIDIVLLWVDGNDPEWQAEFNKYASENNKVHNGINRFRDWDNLNFLFRGIEKFLPWVRNIHFVTWGHIPYWLNKDHPKIKIHKHSDIFLYKDSLPVFNASAIELNIGNIPNLAEKFIFFNDDCFILKPLAKSRFFEKGLPVDFLIETFPRKGFLFNLIRGEDVWNSMINNSLHLINSNYSKKQLLNKNKNYYFCKEYSNKDKIKNFLFSKTKKFNSFKHYHFPMPYTKETILYAYKNYSSEIQRTIESRFRNHDNISQALFRYIHLAKGNFEPADYNDYYIYSIMNDKSLNELKKTINHYSIICINDELKDPSIFLKLKGAIIQELNSILPEKSNYEI